MVELLAPAGSQESLYAAVNAGADAVYVGGSMFGARAYADNPDRESLIDGIEYCHLHGRKLYMTVNTLLKEEELEQKLYAFLLPYYEKGLDGVIVQDFGVVQFLQKYFPLLPIHASTQMTVTSAYGAELLRQSGVSRIVPARELSLREVRHMIEETGLEVETFIHGAMCYSYSGQCLFSSMLGGRSGNRGRCAQPCRLPYSVSGTKEAYLLSMKDLCTIDLLPELIDAGIASMKIEGRMKRPEYTAGVVSVYRKYIDLYLEKGRGKYTVTDEDRKILEDLYNRGGFSEGYYKNHNGKAMMALKRPNHRGTEAAAVKRTANGTAELVALETLHRGDVLELGADCEVTLSQDVAPTERFRIRQPKLSTRPGNVVYRTKNETLLSHLHDAYIKQNCREKIKGDLRIFQDTPAILKLWNDQCGVAVSGIVAEDAKTRATTQEEVRRQVQKTGNTPFIFETLDIQMSDDLFVSVRSLNELRRDGLLKLQEEILSRFHRKIDKERRDKLSERGQNTRSQLQKAGGRQEHDGEAKCSASPKDFNTPRYRLTIAVTTYRQLEAALFVSDAPIEAIYLDSVLFGGVKGRPTDLTRLEDAIRSIKDRGIRCHFSCPPVLREVDRELFQDKAVRKLMRQIDGFLLHTIDELSYFQSLLSAEGIDAELIADDSLYSCNHWAEQFLREHGITGITLPAELNFRELKGLGASGKELIVYGRQPLMHSAQCVKKNVSSCTGKPEMLYLQDRKKVKFPVLNRCITCCNTIYNSVPLQLGGCRDEIERLSPSRLRLSFTVESPDETKRILKQYTELFFAEKRLSGTDVKGTRGHFKRGVE